MVINFGEARQGKKPFAVRLAFGILSALLGLALLWPATAAHANTTLFEDSFSPQQPGWSFASPSAGFLGELNNNTNVPSVTLSVDAPEAGTGTLEFDLLTFRSLDGVFNCCADTLTFSANGQTAFSGLFGGAGSVGFLSNPSGAATDPPILLSWATGWSHHFSVPVTLSAGQNTFTWAFTTLQPLFDEAWGLDNVKLTGPSSNDTAAPTINCNPADGSWHSNNVSIACTASDGESGLANPADASFTLSTNVPAGAEDANASTNSHTVCDQAGNCTAAGPTAGNMVDRKAPEVTCASADDEWHNDNVNIPCTALDGFLANPSQANFVLSTSLADGFEIPDASTNELDICDLAGNCTKAGPVPNNRIDRKDPVILVSSPESKVYILNESVPASYTCNDVSLLACTGTVPNGINLNTSTLGAHTFVVSAADKAGNVTTQTVTYIVDAFRFCPVHNTDKAYKGGSVAIKLTPCASDGTSIPMPDMMLNAQSTTNLSTSTTTAVDAAGNSNLDNSFSYNASTNTYLFRIGTKLLDAGNYLLNFTVGNNPAPIYTTPFTLNVK